MTIGKSGFAGCSGNAMGMTGWNCSDNVVPEHLSHLNLICNSGGYKNPNGTGQTYFVKSNKNAFNMTLTEEEFKNIAMIYNIFLRKDKLQKISEL